MSTEIPLPKDAVVGTTTSTSTNTNTSNYDVGYAKPPVATRFTASHSGNPRGRPKGSRNVATTLLRELGAVVTIQENGRRRKITKLEAIMKQQVNLAASGDQRSAQFVVGLVQTSESAPAPTSGPLSSEADEQMKKALLQRMRALVKQSDGGGDEQY